MVNIQNNTPVLDKKTQVFFLIFFLLIFLSLSATFYKFIILQDFLVIEAPLETEESI